MLSMFALGAIGVSAAQAEKIELGACYEVPTHWGGKYSDSGCTKEAVHKSGAYEWASYKPDSVQRLKIRGEGTVAFEAAAGTKIACSAFSGTTLFPYKTPTAWTPHWLFDGCESKGQLCANEDNLSGEISNMPSFYEVEGEKRNWAFKLGFVSDAEPANPVVGLQYTVQNKQELLFGPISCEAEEGETVKTMYIGTAKGKASWIATIGPVNTMTHELTETYSESAPGVQSPAGFEGKKAGHLENWVPGEQHWEPVAIVATFQDEAEGDIEIKATR